METTVGIISFVHHTLAIFTSSIAIYLFITKRKAISSAFRILLNYSSQLTLSELKMKMDLLNNLKVDNGEQSAQMIEILHDIVGQMRGNQMLSKKCIIILRKMEKVADKPELLTNPRKRALVSELREHLRHIDMENIDELMGDKK